MDSVTLLYDQMNIKSDSSNVLTCTAHRFTLNAMTKSGLLSEGPRSNSVAAKVGQRQHTRHIRLRLQNNDILFHQFQISPYFVKDLIGVMKSQVEDCLTCLVKYTEIRNT